MWNLVGYLATFAAISMVFIVFFVLLVIWLLVSAIRYWLNGRRIERDRKAIKDHMNRWGL